MKNAPIILLYICTLICLSKHISNAKCCTTQHYTCTLVAVTEYKWKIIITIIIIINSRWKWTGVSKLTSIRSPDGACYACAVVVESPNERNIRIANSFICIIHWSGLRWTNVPPQFWTVTTLVYILMFTIHVWHQLNITYHPSKLWQAMEKKKQSYIFYEIINHTHRTISSYLRCMEKIEKYYREQIHILTSTVVAIRSHQLTSEFLRIRAAVLSTICHRTHSNLICVWSLAVPECSKRARTHTHTCEANGCVLNVLAYMWVTKSDCMYDMIESECLSLCAVFRSTICFVWSFDVAANRNTQDAQTPNTK